MTYCYEICIQLALGNIYNKVNFSSSKQDWYTWDFVSLKPSYSCRYKSHPQNLSCMWRYNTCNWEDNRKKKTVYKCLLHLTILHEDNVNWCTSTNTIGSIWSWQMENLENRIYLVEQHRKSIYNWLHVPNNMLLIHSLLVFYLITNIP